MILSGFTNCGHIIDHEELDFHKRTKLKHDYRHPSSFIPAAELEWGNRLPYLKEIGPSPKYDTKSLYRSSNVCVIKDTDPEVESRQIFTLCPFCDPFKNVDENPPTKFRRLSSGERAPRNTTYPQLYDEIEYELHMKKCHGLLKNNSLVRKPFIGICEESISCSLSKEDLEISCICPYSHNRVPCLAEFKLEEKTTRMHNYEEYLNHVYVCHGPEERSRDLDECYKTVFINADGRVERNIFYPLNFSKFLETLGLLNLDCEGITNENVLQPFVLPNLKSDLHDIQLLVSGISLSVSIRNKEMIERFFENQYAVILESAVEYGGIGEQDSVQEASIEDLKQEDFYVEQIPDHTLVTDSPNSPTESYTEWIEAANEGASEFPITQIQNPHIEEKYFYLSIEALFRVFNGYTIIETLENIHPICTCNVADPDFMALRHSHQPQNSPLLRRVSKELLGFAWSEIYGHAEVIDEEYTNIHVFIDRFRKVHFDSISQLKIEDYQEYDLMLMRYEKNLRKSSPEFQIIEPSINLPKTRRLNPTTIDGIVRGPLDDRMSREEQIRAGTLGRYQGHLRRSYQRDRSSVGPDGQTRLIGSLLPTSGENLKKLRRRLNYANYKNIPRNRNYFH